MARRYAIYDVFTEQALAGNPLAVVFDTDGLDGAAMQAIAREFVNAIGIVRHRTHGTDPARIAHALCHRHREVREAGIEKLLSGLLARLERLHRQHQSDARDLLR